MVVKLTDEEVYEGFNHLKRYFIELAMQKVGMDYPVYGNVEGLLVTYVGDVCVRLREGGLMDVSSEPTDEVESTHE